MTGASYQLTGTAEIELREILLYVAERDGVDRAFRVHDKFLDAFRAIATMPDAGFKRPNLTGDRVRWRPVFKWLVIYDPDDSLTTILRVIHGARELEQLFSEND